MPGPEESQDWISDARVHGIPVMVTGVLLLTVVLGLPAGPAADADGPDLGRTARVPHA
jgi:hypothetical protein